jgi:hypothetical protein
MQIFGIINYSMILTYSFLNFFSNWIKKIRYYLMTFYLFILVFFLKVLNIHTLKISTNEKHATYIHRYINMAPVTKERALDFVL